ncbi:regulatory protein RecX [Streptobacillus moniliformis]|uniref:regulatory protein RecX n=1 Tax=Streptobacillus moniliformis TaxID=34105 RepID=UPI0007E461EF|nr:regulatory protein RecX [Streptobacillus moniliformis]
MKIIENILKNKVYVNNGEIIDINLDIKAMFKLKKGMDITGIYHDIIHESMMSKSIYIITLKDRTVFELIQKLKSKYNKENHFIINDVIEKLKKLNLLDDKEFVFRYVNINPNYSINKLKSKLISKGISIDIINEVLSELDLNENQEELIKKFILKNSKLDKQKLFRKLINKGFEYSSILNCLNYGEDE